jgi:putative ABC transport system permease protein
MGNLLQDLRYGLRMLLKSPGYTAIAMITLALGIGANTAIFSVADAFLLRPVSFPDVDRLVMVLGRAPGVSWGWNSVSAADYEDWKQQNHGFEPLAATTWHDVNLTGSGDPEHLTGYQVTANFFDTLHVKPMLGRGFRAEEEQPGQDQETVLSYGLWQRRFAGDPNIVGQTIELDGHKCLVVGVMPKGFEYPKTAELWSPLVLDTRAKMDRNNRYLMAMTRLKPGVKLDQAQAEMNTVAERLGNSYPNTDHGWGIWVMPIQRFATSELTRSYTLMLVGAVAFVLLIACANVANLQFARATGRQKEIAVRMALGATRWQVTRQLLIESILLSLFSIVLALFMASWALHLILSNMPPAVARFIAGWDQISLDWRAFAFSLSIAILAGIISGLAPALQGTHSDLETALKEGGRSGTAGVHRQRLRGVFVVAQVALALVLLVGAGLMTKGFRNLLEVNRSASPDSMLTFNVSLPDARYKKPRQIAAFYDEAMQRIQTIPSVRSAAVVTQLPFAEGGDVEWRQFAIEGRIPASTGEVRHAVVDTVSPSYFPLMGIGLRDGRLLGEQDSSDSTSVALINQELARKYWPQENPLGKRIRVGSDSSGAFLTVVGVVGNVNHSWINPGPEPAIYRSYRQHPPSGMTFAVRTASDPLTLLPQVRAAIAGIDRQLPLDEAKTFAQMIHESVVGLGYVAVMLMVMGIIALVLATIGVYGVLAYSVVERTHEFGIRMALGAKPADVLKLTLGRGVLLVAIGTLVGLPLSGLLAHLLGSILFGVQASDPTMFAVTTMALAGAALLASYIPARRATRIEPTVALRYE